jgi:hypothetical protein
VKEEGSYWWEEPFFQTKAKEKADAISAEVDDFNEALENHLEICDVLKIKTEPSDFEALHLQTHHVQF